ncbi:hypothetical protein BD414DRAFT_477264 [Trametes punicea]|nr:hypothetical protein BD414DRAFT_477264 [Trametes punicea]
MLVLTPVPAHITPYVPRPAFYSEIEYYDAVAEQAARDYAAASARVRAIERQREQARQQRLLEEATRRQAALDDYYREQSRLIAASVRSHTHVRRPSACAIEELGYSVRGEEQRRCTYLAPQREVQRIRVLAQAKEFEEAKRRRRAQIEAQQAREEQEAFLALLGLTAVTSKDLAVSHESRNPIERKNVSAQSPATSSSSRQPVDMKGKRKALNVDPIAVTPPIELYSEAPSFKKELEARIRSETDSEVRESLVKLYSDIFDAPQTQASRPIPGPSFVRDDERAPFSPSATRTMPTQPVASARAAEVDKTDGAHLHRTPALPPAVAEKLLKFYHARRARKLSLAQIKEVEDALRKLETTFKFPEQLDFVNPVASDLNSDSDEPGALAYTANNKPLHAYEHALNGLLTRLDAVESNGDLHVRGRRKEVVKEVERALQAMERRVEESRERERERSRERRRSGASSPLATSAPTSDVEGDVPAVDSKIESTVESVSAPAYPAAELPEADTVSVALFDSFSPVDTVPVSLVKDLDSAAFSTQELTVPEPDTVSVALVDVPSSVSDLPSATPVKSPPSSAHASAESEPTVPSAPVLDAPEPDAVSMSPVDLPAGAASPVTNNVDSVASGEAVSLSVADPSPISPEADVSAEEGMVDIDPYQPSDSATFVTAHSTVPSTVAPPTPVTISRVASAASAATFTTADYNSTSASPIHTDPDTVPMTRVPSQAPSVAEETFLLSSSPLADDSLRERSGKHEGREEDGLEIISKDEVAKSDSEWSDVESA